MPLTDHLPYKVRRRRDATGEAQALGGRVVLALPLEQQPTRHPGGRVPRVGAHRRRVRFESFVGGARALVHRTRRLQQVGALGLPPEAFAQEFERLVECASALTQPRPRNPRAPIVGVELRAPLERLTRPVHIALLLETARTVVEQVKVDLERARLVPAQLQERPLVLLNQRVTYAEGERVAGVSGQGHEGQRSGPPSANSKQRADAVRGRQLQRQRT